MPESRGQLRRGDIGLESRDPRFAELDDQIEAGEAARQGRPDVVRKAKRHRTGPRLPRVVQKPHLLESKMLGGWLVSKRSRATGNCNRMLQH
jgi:hypothetical protein